MAKEQSHTATTTSQPGSCVPCKVSITRKVSYVFKTGLWPNAKPSETKLHIPVAVAVCGAVKPEYDRKAGVLASQQTLHVWVEPGQAVNLYLNSDADPAWRRAPVFSITPTERDVLVIVSERRGRLGELDAPKLVATRQPAGGRPYDEYEATLSGDTWKKVSHRYTAGEASGLIPADTTAAVRRAVTSIYDGSLKGKLRVPFTDAGGATGSTAQTLTITFEDASNPRDNLISFDLYADGLPRVHPQAWLAVIEAAQAAGVHEVTTSSAWRPMLGSIVHRSGFGLDVSYLDKAHLNRQGLTNAKAPRSEWVSSKEKELFAQKVAAEREEVVATKTLDELTNELTRVQGTSATRRAQLETNLAEAQRSVRRASRRVQDTNRAWNDERDAQEPPAAKSFRTFLSKCKCVSQVFDPWFMDSNTRDMNRYRMAAVAMLCASQAGPAMALEDSTRIWIERPWEFRYVLEIDDPEMVAISRQLDAESLSKRDPSATLGLTAIAPPETILKLSTERRANSSDRAVSGIVIRFNQLGEVISPYEWPQNLSGHIDRIGTIILAPGNGADDLQFWIGYWYTGRSSEETAYIPAICNSFDMRGRYKPGFKANNIDGNFGCREWGYYLRNDKYPYIDITSYQKDGSFIRPIVGWGRFDTPPKPVIGKHRDTWVCLLECPDGDAPGVIPDIAAWASRHGWPVPKPPKKMPMFPDTPRKRGEFVD